MRLPFSSPLPAVWLVYLAGSLFAKIGDPALAQLQHSSAYLSGLQEVSHSISSGSDATDGLITLDVVVTDKSGKLVTDLSAADFTLIENGQPNRIVSFHAFDGISAKPDPPVKVILLIDTLNLPHELGSHEREEVERYLRHNDGHLSQHTAIFELSDGGGRWVAQSSRNGNDLAAAIARSQVLTAVRPLRGNPRAPFIRYC
jgi:VWFA-related protein